MKRLLPERARLWAGVWLVLTIAYLLAVPAGAATNQLSADEPQYLLMTHSLLSDGDLDLADEYADRSYEPFHHQGLLAQDAPDEHGRRFSPHNPGLSVVLVPGYAIGGWVGARIELALLGATTMTLAGVLAARLTRRRRLSAAAAVLVGLTATVWVYATQVYPELPAAGLVVAATFVLTGTLRDRRPIGAAVGLAATVVALAWLGSKYLPLCVALTALGLFALRRHRGALATLVSILAAGAASQALFNIGVYGGLTPYSSNRIYSEGSTSFLLADNAGGWDTSYRLLGLIADRHFGLARYAPLWIVAAPAVLFAPLAAARGVFGRLEAAGGALRTGFAPVTVLVLVQWATATWLTLTIRGYWFPGRQVVTVLPLVVPGVVLAFVLLPRLAAVLGALSVALGGAMVWALGTGRVGAARDPFWLPVPGFIDAGAVFPNYRGFTAETYLLSAVWLAVLAGAGVLVWRRIRAVPGPAATGLGDGHVLVGFPARDEEATVGDVVARAGALEMGREVRVVVVDDASTDATAERAEAAGATVLSVDGGGTGLGAGVRTILAHGAATGAAAVVFMDADGEYHPEDVPALLAPIERGEADYVTGDRFAGAGGRPERMPGWRRRGNRFGSVVLSSLTGRRVHDAQSGIRVLGAAAAQAASIRHDYNYAQVLTIDLCRRGFAMAELPCTYARRPSGRTFVRLPTYLRRVVPAMLGARFGDASHGAVVAEGTSHPAAKPKQLHAREPGPVSV